MRRSSVLHGVNSLSLLTYRLDGNSLSQHSGEPAVVENNQESSKIYAENTHTHTYTAIQNTQTTFNRMTSTTHPEIHTDSLQH